MTKLLPKLRYCICLHTSSRSDGFHNPRHIESDAVAYQKLSLDQSRIESDVAYISENKIFINYNIVFQTNICPLGYPKDITKYINQTL
jgi:hypothetical protein